MRNLLCLVALVAALAAPAAWGDSPGADRVDQGAWKQADLALSHAQTSADALAQRLALLKKQRAQSPQTFTRGAELDDLLRASVAAERAVAEQTRLRDDEARKLTQRIDRELRGVDDGLQRERPRLQSKTESDRVAAARAMKQLLDARQGLKGLRAQVERRGAEPPRAWAQYDVKVDPLDGPLDLREKADFVEDTRDKLRKKRQELERLVREAREERELARVTRSFRTEVGLFDEQSRSGRVTRRPGGGNETLAVSDGAPSRSGGSPPPTTAPATPAPTPGATGGTEGRDSNSFEGTGAISQQPQPSVQPQPPSQAGGAQTPGAQLAPLPRQLDASALLNLNPSAIAGSADPEALAPMLADLEALERYLGARAEALRERAQRLEGDESRR